jgi:hypothetical protein
MENMTLLINCVFLSIVVALCLTLLNTMICLIQSRSTFFVGFHSLGKYWEEWEAKVAQDVKMDQQEPNWLSLLWRMVKALGRLIFLKHLLEAATSLRTLSLVMFCCPLLWSFVMVWIETQVVKKKNSLWKHKMAEKFNGFACHQRLIMW